MSEPTIEAEPRQCWIAGASERGERSRTIRHPFDDTDVADVTVPDAEQVERAVAAADAVARQFRRSTATQRRWSLERVADLLMRRSEEFAETITAESGKPWRWAELEVGQAVEVFRAAAAAANGFGGELSGFASGSASFAGARRRARGPVLAIGSSTLPLAGPVRQIALALAVGAPVISKPASLTPLSALLLGEILAEAGLPSGAFSVLPLRGKDMADLVQDARLPVVSMIGSRAAGEAVQALAPTKRFVLELGGTTTAIVCPDLASDLDLAVVAERIAVAATAQAGQSRLAVRRVFVHQDVAEAFQAKLLGAVRELATGSPHDPEVTIGPLVSEEAAIVATQWVNDTIAGGATLLTGGVRDRATLTPTVLTVQQEFQGEEILAPVLLISTVDSVRSAFRLANASGSTLPVGVLTHDLRTALLAADELAADVVVGQPPAEAAVDDIDDVLNAYTRRQTLVLSGGLDG